MRLLKRFIIIHIVLNAFFISWTFAENSDDQSENWVKVEKQLYVSEGEDKKDYRFLSFKERRPSWGFRLGVSTEKIKIVDYTVSTVQTANAIRSSSMDFGLQLMVSYNLPVFSVGVGSNLGFYNFKGDVSAIKFGADVNVFMDGLLNTPYIVPYLKLGAGRYNFSNPGSSDVSTHETKISPYYAVGGLFLLDWLQKTMSMEAFYNFGVEGSFLFFEMEDFTKLQSANSNLPGDFKSRTYKVGLMIVF